MTADKGSDRVAAALAARRKQAVERREQAWAAFDALMREGGPVDISAVAHRAGVSRNLIYDTPDLLERIKNARGGRRTGPTRTRDDRDEVAGLKAKLRHASEQVTRLDRDLRLAHQALAGGDRDQNSAATQEELARCNADVARLQTELVTTSNALHAATQEIADLNENYQAARERVRETIRDLNQTRSRLEEAEAEIARLRKEKR